MKKAKKTSTTINGYVKSGKVYENYLITRKQVNGQDQGNANDLKDFMLWGMEELDNVYSHLWGVRMDYEFVQSEEMEKTAREWMEFVQNENRKLMEFPEVDRDSIKKLPAVGISTFDQLLEASSTKADREALAARSGASPDSILELVKLSNLSQLPGFKKVRGRLFFKAGLDSLSKIAALESEEI